LFGSRLGPFGRGEEEGPLGVLTEFMDEDAETAGGVAEACGGLGRGESLDEVGAQGLVAAVRGVDGLQEAVGEGR
jgi:hypothetical protein